MAGLNAPVNPAPVQALRALETGRSTRTGTVRQSGVGAGVGAGVGVAAGVEVGRGVGAVVDPGVGTGVAVGAGVDTAGVGAVPGPGVFGPVGAGVFAVGGGAAEPGALTPGVGPTDGEPTADAAGLVTAMPVGREVSLATRPVGGNRTPRRTASDATATMITPTASGARRSDRRRVVPVRVRPAAPPGATR